MQTQGRRGLGWSVKSALRAQAERAACPPTSHSLVDASEQRVDCSPLHLFVALAVAVVVILYLRHIFNWHEDMVGAFLALFKATQGLPSATRACAREREQERLRERVCVCVFFCVFVYVCVCEQDRWIHSRTHALLWICRTECADCASPHHILLRAKGKGLSPGTGSISSPR